jgi:hypothetical protein
MQSPVYWHPKLYAFTMRKLYGRFYHGRYTNLEKLIPENCELLELSMGDLYFYENYLKNKNIKYSCADINPIFVQKAKAKNIHAGVINMLKDEIPKSDYILLQGALYHSIPDQEKFITKLFNSVNKQLIISECVKNVSNSSNGLVSYLGAFMSKAKAGQSRIKFTNETLKQAFSGFEKNIVQWIEPDDSMETIIVLQK